MNARSRGGNDNGMLFWLQSSCFACIYIYTESEREREREREVVCCFIYRFISSCIYFDLDIYLSIWIAYTHAWRVLFSYWHLQVDHVAHPRPHARKECSCLRQRTCWVPRMHRGVIDEVCMKSEVCGVRCQGNNPNSWTTSRQYLKGPGGDGSRACPAWPNRNCGWLWPVKFRRNEQGIHQRICSQNDPVWRTSNTCSLFASRCVSVCAWNNNFACLPPEIQPRTISNQSILSSELFSKSSFVVPHEFSRVYESLWVKNIQEMSWSLRCWEPVGIKQFGPITGAELTQPDAAWRSLTQPALAEKASPATVVGVAYDSLALFGSLWQLYGPLCSLLCFEILVLKYPKVPRIFRFSFQDALKGVWGRRLRGLRDGPENTRVALCQAPAAESAAMAQGKGCFPEGAAAISGCGNVIYTLMEWDGFDRGFLHQSMLFCITW